MKFELRPLSNLLEGGYRWEWVATIKGEIVAQSPDEYPTEAAARSSIAKARKAFAGAKFAKVECPELEDA